MQAHCSHENHRTETVKTFGFNGSTGTSTDTVCADCGAYIN